MPAARSPLDLRRPAASLEGEHPDAVVVSYVNTTADVKAETDYCCTSGNASIGRPGDPEDREILFLPDLYLGLWVERVTGRKLTIWMGECHVHAGIRPGRHRALAGGAPDAEFLVHPECGCASQCMAFGNDNTHILSTEGMIKFARQSPKERFLVATETGILHRLAKEAPEKRFEAVSEQAICKYMKMITLEKLRDSLRDMKHEVRVEPDIAAGRVSPSSAWSDRVGQGAKRRAAAAPKAPGREAPSPPQGGDTSSGASAFLGPPRSRLPPAELHGRLSANRCAPLRGLPPAELRGRLRQPLRAATRLARPPLNYAAGAANRSRRSAACFAWGPGTTPAPTLSPLPSGASSRGVDLRPRWQSRAGGPTGG